MAEAPLGGGGRMGCAGAQQMFLFQIDLFSLGHTGSLLPRLGFLWLRLWGLLSCCGARAQGVRASAVQHVG